MPKRGLPALIVACVLWLACAAYVWPFVTRGWIAHDEGTIAQSAERTLRGELPHRDFDEPYTGGLSYMHAAAMRLFGVNLRAPRLMLFSFFMAFLVAASAIAWRVARGFSAAVATVLVVVWSTPNYFAALPSWYTLFFATFGILGFIRFLDTGTRAWLVLAGVFGGLSMLMKITGVYYVAGALLFLTYLEQSRSASPGGDAGRSRFWLVIAIPAVALLLMLPREFWLTVIAPQLLPVSLPPLGLSVFVVWLEWSAGRGSVAARVSRYFALTLPFLLGVALPVGAFLLWYWHNAALTDLMRGVFILPQRRLTEASLTPPSLATLGLAVPYVALFLIGRRGVRREPLVAMGLALGLAVALLDGNSPLAFGATWVAARSMTLVAAFVGACLLLDRSPEPADLPETARRREATFLLVTMAAFLGLVQFPYASPTYFCYVAPVIVLALTALVSAWPQSPRRLHFVVAVYFVVFAAVFVNQSYGWNLGVRFIPYHPTARLEIDRGGLIVPDEDKATYEKLVHLLREHAEGGTIYAGPDCPEIYFLAGFPNPTRAIFEFISLEGEDENWMAGLLATTPIRAAVINTAPLFSHPLDPRVVARLEHRFPSAVRVGRFVVRFE